MQGWRSANTGQRPFPFPPSTPSRSRLSFGHRLGRTRCRGILPPQHPRPLRNPSPAPPPSTGHTGLAALASGCQRHGNPARLKSNAPPPCGIGAPPSRSAPPTRYPQRMTQRLTGRTLFFPSPNLLRVHDVTSPRHTPSQPTVLVRIRRELCRESVPPRTLCAPPLHLPGYTATRHRAPCHWALCAIPSTPRRPCATHSRPTVFARSLPPRTLCAPPFYLPGYTPSRPPCAPSSTLRRPCATHSALLHPLCAQLRRRCSKKKNSKASRRRQRTMTPLPRRQ